MSIIRLELFFVAFESGNNVVYSDYDACIMTYRNILTVVDNLLN